MWLFSLSLSLCAWWNPKKKNTYLLCIGGINLYIKKHSIFGSFFSFCCCRVTKNSAMENQWNGLEAHLNQKNNLRSNIFFRPMIQQHSKVSIFFSCNSFFLFLSFFRHYNKWKRTVLKLTGFAQLEIWCLVIESQKMCNWFEATTTVTALKQPNWLIAVGHRSIYAIYFLNEND